MTKPYDATMKTLLDEFAIDWIGWLAPRFGLPATTEAEPLDVDLSTVQLEADKVFRLKHPANGLLHIEPQTAHDLTFPDRILAYNVMLERKYGGPVHSIALLLRPQAQATNITGHIQRRYDDERIYLQFQYEVIRVWELDLEPLMRGNIGAIPLALLTDQARGRLPELVDRIDERLRAEPVDDTTRRLLLTSSYILLGLRYDREEIRSAFVRVNGMKDSTTYQAILQEGREEGIQTGRLNGMLEGMQTGIQTGRKEGLQTGIVAARQEDLVDIIRERFGAVPELVEARIRATLDSAKLQAAIRQAVRVTDPNEILR